MSLPDILSRVAREEGMKLQELPENYNKYYLEANIERLRCVDERVLTEKYSEYDTTPQTPGNDWSLVDTLMIFTGMNEMEASQLVQTTLSSMGLKPTSHEHCGYLKLASLNGETRKEATAHSPNGVIEEYVGEHIPQALAIINLQEGTTFNCRGANKENSPAFNNDYWFAKKFGEAEGIRKRTLKSGEEFANSVARLYFRTIKALTYSDTIYFR